MTLVEGIVFVEFPSPVLHLFQDLIGIAAPQFTQSAITCTVFGQPQVFQEDGNGSAGHLGRFDQGPGWVSDAIDAPVVVVAVGVPSGMLHVTDQGIVPIDEVEGTVGGKFEVDGPKIGIGGINQILPQLTGKTFPVLHHGVLLDSEKSYGVVDEKISLDLIGEMPGIDKFRS